MYPYSYIYYALHRDGVLHHISNLKVNFKEDNLMRIRNSKMTSFVLYFFFKKRERKKTSNLKFTLKLFFNKTNLFLNIELPLKEIYFN